jgi:hypothetical protein
MTQDERDALLDDATHAAADVLRRKGIAIEGDDLDHLNDVLAEFLHDLLAKG